ncbi:TetR family transcriptional regulator, partial [Streptomyces sp. NPDC127044]
MADTSRPSAKPTPDSTRRSEKSRRAIFDAALALVGEVGYPKNHIEGNAPPARVGKKKIKPGWWWSAVVHGV